MGGSVFPIDWNCSQEVIFLAFVRGVDKQGLYALFYYFILYI